MLVCMTLFGSNTSALLHVKFLIYLYIKFILYINIFIYGRRGVKKDTMKREERKGEYKIVGVVKRFFFILK